MIFSNISSVISSSGPPSEFSLCFLISAAAMFKSRRRKSNSICSSSALVLAVGTASFSLTWLSFSALLNLSNSGSSIFSKCSGALLPLKNFRISILSILLIKNYLILRLNNSTKLLTIMSIGLLIVLPTSSRRLSSGAA